MNQVLEDTELYRYLNHDFLDEAFNDFEIDCLISQNTSKVFLLSHEEVKKYVPINQRKAKRTEYNDIRYGLSRYANWQLSNDDNENIVLNDGSLSHSTLNQKHSIRPAIRLDLNKIRQHFDKHNVDYIKEWLLAHNEYLENHKDKEEFLELLVKLVVLFETLYELDHDEVDFHIEDYFVKEGMNVRIVSGSKQVTKETEWILKLINYNYGYLDKDFVKRETPYFYLYKSYYLQGLWTDEDIYIYFLDWYDFLMRYYQNCQFDRIIYKINDCVYYADQPLTKEEIDEISTYKTHDQRQFDVDHNDNGSFNCW